MINIGLINPKTPEHSSQSEIYLHPSFLIKVSQFLKSSYSYCMCNFCITRKNGGDELLVQLEKKRKETQIGKTMTNLCYLRFK